MDLPLHNLFNNNNKCKPLLNNKINFKLEEIYYHKKCLLNNNNNNNNKKKKKVYSEI